MGYCLIPVLWWEQNENFLVCYVVLVVTLSLGRRLPFLHFLGDLKSLGLCLVADRMEEKEQK